MESGVTWLTQDNFKKSKQLCLLLPQPPKKSQKKSTKIKCFFLFYDHPKKFGKMIVFNQNKIL